MAEYQEVSLPDGRHTIWQDATSQGVSRAAELLHNAVLAEADAGCLHAIELGCGCGIVSIICALARPAWQIHALEIQAHLAELARQNAERCGLSLDIRCADLRQAQGQYDLVFSNPPWRKMNSGLMSPLQTRNISRFEISCTMPDLLQTIKRILKPTGKAVVIYPLERWPELHKVADNTLLDIIKHQIQGVNKAYFWATLIHRDII